MFNKLKRKLALHHTNYRGWQTDQKIIVIESDDWGSIRMPSRKVYRALLSGGIPVDRSPYCKYDSLASEDDLLSMFDVLRNYRDSDGRHPAVTANCVVANPDFEKIKKSKFCEYYYEPISDTFLRYPEHGNCLKIWKEGIDDNIFLPQSHGREHLNVPLWLSLLQNNNSIFRTAFENEMWGLSRDVIKGMPVSIQAAFDTKRRGEMNEHKKIIISALDLFEKLFQYRSESFIANNFIWHPDIEEAMNVKGIHYLQGMKYQKLPLMNHKKHHLIRHFLGEKNSFGQIYLIRNCQFEPSLKPENYDNVGECIKSISNAFFWNKPAIISSHRINFVGFLNEKNRKKNLAELNELLSSIIKRWPDVKFLTTVDLGRLMNK